MEHKIIELEKKLSFQEHSIAELTEVVNDQRQKIVDLENQLGTIRDKMNSGDFVRKIEDEEPPPHY